MGVEDLSQQQRDFIQRHIGVALPAPARKGETGPVISLTQLGTARLEWGGVRKAALSGVKSLEDHLQAEYRDDPDAAEALPVALKTLSTLISRFNEDLEDQLDAVLNAPDAERRTLVNLPAATAATFIALCDSDPILGALDGNEFLPDMQVVGPMKQSLAKVVAALGR